MTETLIYLFLKILVSAVATYVLSQMSLVFWKPSIASERWLEFTQSNVSKILRPAFKWLTPIMATMSGVKFILVLLTIVLVLAHGFAT